MMGIKILAALAALSFALSAAAQEPTPFKGSTVFVPPLFTKAPGAVPPPRIMRMPVQAGVVSRVVTTRLPNSAGLALIVKGHKYYSLCTPKQYRVACSPLAGLDSMRDITVGAHVDSNNVSLLSFRIAKETTRTPAELAFAVSHFKRRFAKMGARFDLLSNSYMPKPPPGTPPGKHPPVDPKLNRIQAATLEICTDETSYNYDGGYDCSGGSSGGSSGGYDVDSYPWSIDEDGDTSDTSVIQSYPPSADNGDRDPCLSPSGENICQRVETIARRPERSGCALIGMAWVCQTTPPPTPFDALEPMPPSGPDRSPWLSQSFCNFAHILCTEGQLPQAPEGADHQELVDWAEDCMATAQAMTDRCFVFAIWKDIKWVNECVAEASAFANNCVAEYNRKK